MTNLNLFYFEDKNKLKEINNNIEFDLWEKAFRTILNDILNRKGIFKKSSENSNLESKNTKN